MNTVTGRARTVQPASAQRPRNRRWKLLRHRLGVDGAGALVLAPAFWAAAMVLVVVVSTRVEISISGWAAATQIVRWFVGAMGVYLTAMYLPLYVAHGCTRRDAARQLGTFGALYVALVTVLVVVGFGLERAVYAIADWPQAVEATNLAADATAYPGMLVQYALLLAVWMAGGAMLGAAFYRDGGLGALLVPPAVGLVFATEWAIGAGNDGLSAVPFVGAVTGGPPDLTSVLVVAIPLVGAALMAVATWWVVRDLPLRAEPS